MVAERAEEAKKVARRKNWSMSIRSGDSVEEEGEEGGGWREKSEKMRLVSMLELTKLFLVRSIET